jgi:hypothetical protein
MEYCVGQAQRKQQTSIDRRSSHGLPIHSEASEVTLLRRQLWYSCNGDHLNGPTEYHQPMPAGMSSRFTHNRHREPTTNAPRHALTQLTDKEKTRKGKSLRITYLIISRLYIFASGEAKKPKGISTPCTAFALSYQSYKDV